MTEQTSNPVDPRVDLARRQTSVASFQSQLALDRTTLAWVRTALAMASFGFSMVAFFRSIQQQSPGPETNSLNRGAIRMGAAMIISGSSGRSSPVRPTGSH